MDRQFDILHGSEGVGTSREFSLADVLNNGNNNANGGDYVVALSYSNSTNDWGSKKTNAPEQVREGMGAVTDTLIDWMEENFATVLAIPGDANSLNSVQYAALKLKEMLLTTNNEGQTIARAAVAGSGKKINDIFGVYATQDASSSWFNSNGTSGWSAFGRHKDYTESGVVSITNLAKAFLTLYAEFRDEAGLGDPQNPYAKLQPGMMGAQNIVTDDKKYLYNIYAGSSFTEQECKESAFYDSLRHSEGNIRLVPEESLKILRLLNNAKLLALFNDFKFCPAFFNIAQIFAAYNNVVCFKRGFESGEIFSVKHFYMFARVINKRIFSLQPKRRDIIVPACIAH
jgi:hypothetical protein